jgi:predicted aspartyl protease
MQHAERLSATMLVILAMLAAIGCSDMNTRYTDIMNQGDSAYEEGRFYDAQAAYRRVVETAPSQARAWERLGLTALWKNNLAEAESCLKNAQERGSWWARHWPMNVQLDYHLALTYRRAGRIREAARLLDKAAGPLPIGPLKSLQVYADQLALFNDESFYQIDGPIETAIPFVITDPLPLVQVSINDSPPVNFFIDTGAEEITLDRAYAQTVGAVVVGESKEAYAGNKKGVTGYGKVDHVRLGGLQITGVPVTTLDLKPISQQVFSGMEIGGIIGTGFLAHFLVTIDYPNQQLVLRRRDASMSAFDERDRSFPIWFVETHLIFAEGSFNGRKSSQMLIDTGLAGAGFMTSKENYAAASVEMDWSKAGIGAGGGGEVKALEVSLATVTLGGDDNRIDRHDLIGIVMEHDNSLFDGALGFKVGGLVSHQFFREYAVTFDFQNMRLILQ